VTYNFVKLLGNFRPYRRLLRSLLPETEVDSGRNTNVSLTAEVPRSEREETTAAAAATESTDGNDVNSTTANDDQ